MNEEKFAEHRKKTAMRIAALVEQGMDTFEARVAIFQASVEAQFKNQPAQPEPESTGPRCETCHDQGMVKYNVPVGHELFGKFVPCPNPSCEVANERRQQVWEKRVQMSGVPPEYQKLTFETWDNDLSNADKRDKLLGYAAARLFVANEHHRFAQSDLAIFLGMGGEHLPPGGKNSVMLHGPVGTGKTGLICSAINVLLNQGESVLYIRARDLLKNVQDRWYKKESPTGEDVLRTFQQAPILAIDEFNVYSHEATDHRKGIIEDLMRYRHAHALPTLMTANTTQDEFEAIWGLRTASVVVAMSHWIDVGGISLRNQEVSIGGY